MRSPNTTLSLLALLAALLPAGCAEQDPSLLLTGYYFASGEFDDTEDTPVLRNCAYKAGAGTDVAPAQDVSINLQQLIDNGQPTSGGTKKVFIFGANVENRLASSIRGSTERVNTNIITLKSAKIRYLFSSPVEVERTFNVTVPTNEAALFGIPLVNGDTDIKKLQAAVMAAAGDDGVVTVPTEIVVSGTLLDGTDVESNILEYPVNLCNSCGARIMTTPLCAAE
jgi:hypothetical protein